MKNWNADALEHEIKPAQLDFLKNQVKAVKTTHQTEVLNRMLEFVLQYNQLPNDLGKLVLAEKRAAAIMADYRKVMRSPIEAPSLICAFTMTEARVKYAYKRVVEQRSKGRNVTTITLNNPRHTLPALVEARKEATRDLSTVDRVDSTIKAVVEKNAMERLMDNVSPKEREQYESLDKQRQRYESQLAESKLMPRRRRQLEQSLAAVEKTQNAILDGTLYAPREKLSSGLFVPASQDAKDHEHYTRRKIAIERELSQLQKPNRYDRNSLGLMKRIGQLQSSLATVNARLEEIETRQKERSH